MYFQSAAAFFPGGISSFVLKAICQRMLMSCLLHFGLLKRETSLKVGIHGKRLEAVWREDYLMKVLRG